MKATGTPRAVRATLLAGLLAFTSASFADAQGGSVLGRVRVSLSEDRRGGPPQLALALSTLHEFGCVGYSIRTASRRSGDTLRIDLVGIDGPGEVCLTAMGPAEVRHPLRLPPGRYTLRLRATGREDRIRLEITASSARLVPVRATFAVVDTMRLVRHPPRSFAFSCNLYAETRALCANVAAWIGRQGGIRALTFPRGARNPFRPEGEGSSDDYVRFFQYDDDAALRRIRQCFGRIEPHVREAVGVVLTVESWTGERFNAWSRRSNGERHIAPPADVAARVCGPRA